MALASQEHKSCARAAPAQGLLVFAFRTILTNIPALIASHRPVVRFISFTTFRAVRIIITVVLLLVSLLDKELAGCFAAGLSSTSFSTFTPYTAEVER